MIISLRDNRKLLRHRTPFEKGRRFEDPDMTTFEARHRPIAIRHLSKEELSAIQEETIARNHHEFRKILLKAALLFSIFFAIIYIASTRFTAWLEVRREVSAETIYRQKLEEYAARIGEGDFLVSQSYFGEAIYQYRKATELFPYSIKANVRLANAYMKSCLEDYTYCDEGKKHLDRIIELYPDEVVLLEIRAMLFLAADQMDKAYEDYRRIDEILK